jgi:hypothetical protein
MPIIWLEDDAGRAAAHFATEVASGSSLGPIVIQLSKDPQLQAILISPVPIHPEQVGTEFRFGGLRLRSSQGADAPLVSAEAELASWIGQKLDDAQISGGRLFVTQSLLAKSTDPVVRQWRCVQTVGDEVFSVARRSAEVVDVIRQGNSALHFLGVLAANSGQSIEALVVDAFDGEAFLALQINGKLALPGQLLASIEANGAKTCLN